MAKEKPLPDVGEEQDELSVIDDEIDRALDGLKSANEKVIDLLEHIEASSREGDPDGDQAAETGASGDAPGEDAHDTQGVENSPSEESDTHQGRVAPDSP